MNYRPCTVQCLFGKVRYERAYYYCRHCQNGFFPADQAFHLEEKQSLAAMEVIALSGVNESFEECGERSLRRMSGLLVSQSTVQRTTERVGNDVADRRSGGEIFASPTCWEWEKDALGQRVGYVSLDATGVPQQAFDHKKAECRMAWVGSVFTVASREKKPRKPLSQARYLSGLMSLPEMSAQLGRECEAVGLGAADVVVGLTDGGNGLENCLLQAVRGQIREIHFILDFYHVKEYLVEFGKLLIGNEEDRKSQVKRWCEELKQEGGESLLRELTLLDVSSGHAGLQEKYRQLLNYVRNNLHRMDYPEYLRRGWQIGSGVIESACKSVVGVRMKGPGMRWREYGTHGMCQLRALFKSKGDLWAQYWKRRNAV